eukprot:754978-Hanusia_phi.AAC.4
MMPGIANVLLLRSRKSSRSFMEGSSPGGNPSSTSQRAEKSPFLRLPPSNPHPLLCLIPVSLPPPPDSPSCLLSPLPPRPSTCMAKSGTSESVHPPSPTSRCVSR